MTSHNMAERDVNARVSKYYPGSRADRPNYETRFQLKIVPLFQSQSSVEKPGPVGGRFLQTRQAAVTLRDISDQILSTADLRSKRHIMHCIGDSLRNCIWEVSVCQSRTLKALLNVYNYDQYNH